jgi:serine/threonine-protein kinase PknG
VPGAIAAFDRVPSFHRPHADAQGAAVRMLIAAGHFAEAGDRLTKAANVEEDERVRIESQLYEAALRSLKANAGGDTTVNINGRRLSERDVRLALEAALRRQARLASTDSERLALIDRANHRRPFTLL